VACEIVERAAGRGDVDEPKQRRPQTRVALGQLHRLAVDRLERRPRARGQRAGQGSADAPDLRLEFDMLEGATGHLPKDTLVQLAGRPCVMTGEGEASVPAMGLGRAR
jgi:hypothetical protein